MYFFYKSDLFLEKRDDGKWKVVSIGDDADKVSTLLNCVILPPLALINWKNLYEVASEAQMTRHFGFRLYLFYTIKQILCSRCKSSIHP